MKRLRSSLLGLLAAAPFAAFAGVADLSLEPAAIADDATAQQIAIDQAKGAPPAIPDREMTGVAPAQCCWMFYHGKWWCVPCDG